MVSTSHDDINYNSLEGCYYTYTPASQYVRHDQRMHAELAIGRFERLQNGLYDYLNGNINSKDEAKQKLGKWLK